jgi:hypothetical protein
MAILQQLSLLAMQQLIEGVCDSLGFRKADVLINHLKEHFGNQSQRLADTLAAANQRAWQALEIALAGESWWEQVQLALARGEDRAFRQQVRAFLDVTPLAGLPGHGPEFRQQCLRELRTARKAGVLTQGRLEPGALAQEAGALASFGSPQRLLDAEWRAVTQLAEEIRQANFATLAHFLALRPAEGPPLLVVAVRYFFRRQVETDQQLFQGLAFAHVEQLTQQQRAGFEALSEALGEHGRQLEELLDDVLGLVRQSHEGILDIRREMQRQGEQVQQWYREVLRLLEQNQLQTRELRPSDSRSLEDAHERARVREVVAGYRALPAEQRRQLPALLHGLGKAQVLTGDLDDALRDFQEAATLVEDAPQAQAEVHYNAYLAALEKRTWPAALDALAQAARLNEERYAPFPLDKYEP